MAPAGRPPAARVLVAYLGDGSALPGPLADLEAWLAASSRLRTFVDANRDKIRKKVRLATTADAQLDLRTELRFASLLLANRRFDLAFEAYGSGNRGPDFTATFRAGTTFNVEVTRRHVPGVAGVERTILGKLRQLPPSRANVLLVAFDAPDEAAIDLDPIVRDLRSHAERRDDAWFVARGMADAAAFHQGLLRLTALIAWQERRSGDSASVSWINPGARIAADTAALRALATALRDDPA